MPRQGLKARFQYRIYFKKSGLQGLPWIGIATLPSMEWQFQSRATPPGHPSLTPLQRHARAKSRAVTPRHATPAELELHGIGIAFLRNWNCMELELIEFYVIPSNPRRFVKVTPRHSNAARTVTPRKAPNKLDLQCDTWKSRVRSGTHSARGRPRSQSLVSIIVRNWSPASSNFIPAESGFKFKCPAKTQKPGAELERFWNCKELELI